MRSSLTELFLFLPYIDFTETLKSLLFISIMVIITDTIPVNSSIFCTISKDLTLSNVMCPERQIIIIRNNRTSECHTEEVTYQYALAV